MTALAAAEGADGIADPQRRKRAVASVLAGMALVVLDAAIANIALPTIAVSFRIEPSSAVRVVTAYQLGLIMMLLPAAAIGESYGYRRIFIAGAAVFTAASVLCALSPSMNWLLAARFAQGVGGAGVMSLGIALLRFVVPCHRLGAAIGWNALTVALSSAAGPTLGAVILSFGPWPWIFAVNLPIGASVLVTARALPRTRVTGRPLDLASAAISASMFAAFVFGAEYVQSNPVKAFAFFSGAGLMTVILVRREAHRTDPLIPLDLLSRSSFRVSVIASVLCFAGQTAALVALPFYLQYAFDLSPLMTAFYLSPWPLAVAVTAPLAGKLSDLIQPALLRLIGGILLAIGMGLTCLAPVQNRPLTVGVYMLLCGVGFSLFNVSNNRSMFMSAPHERSAAAGGLQGVARLTGQMLGAVLMASLFGTHQSDTASRIGLTTAALLSLAAGAVSAVCVFREAGRCKG